MSKGSYPMCDIQEDGNEIEFAQNKHKQKKLYIIIIVLLLLICGLIVAVIILAVSEKKPQMEEICTDISCINSASIILNSMNDSIDPCNDFYHFSCGKWITNHMDGHGTRTLQIATEKLDKNLKELFKSAKERKDLPGIVNEIIKAFDVCMSYEGLNSANKAWIINTTNQAGGFPLINNSFHQSLSYNWTDIYEKQFRTYFVDYPFSISIYTNPLDSSENLIHVSAPNLQSESPLLSEDLLREIAESFGRNVSNSTEIDDILWLKNEMKNMSRPYAELMEDVKECQLVTINELQSIYPTVSWLSFLQNLFKDYLDSGTTITGNDEVFLRGKTYIKKMIDMFNNKEISNRLLLNYGGSMFLTELFTYNYLDESNLKLKHSKASNVKWSQCKDFLTKTASPVLDYLYGNFRKEKYVSNELIDYMVKAMKEMIDQSTWLDGPTKIAVQDKLDHMKTFSGFPPWTQDAQKLERYFKSLPKMNNNTFENMFNLKHFSFKKFAELYKKKNDRSKWPPYSEMGGSQVNAFYVPDFNIVIIPAGIQQLPYFQADRPKFMNFGGMGLVYGHEMTHGLDESGSLRDKFGNLKNWWTKKSKAEFKKRSKCFIDQYNSYHYDGLNITVDGRQTLSENIADNGGIRQAYLGYQKWIKDNGKEKRLPGLEKYSPEQLFFISFAESWCSSIHPPSLLATSHQSDSHSADQFRVIGSLSNMKEFSEVFNCKSGSRMNREDKCIIW